MKALTNIADYLATIPGRKNLIWVSGSFPFPYAGWTPSRVTPEDVMKACRAISNANMALYPVDARGLLGPGDIMPTYNAGSRGLPTQQALARDSSYLRGFNSSLETMQIVADRTGGRAFYSTNDITNSIRRAVDDSAVTYMLGFYPRDNEWNTEFHTGIFR